MTTALQVFAQAPAPTPAGGGFASFVPLILIFAIFYFLMIRPQQRTEKERKGTTTLRAEFNYDHKDGKDRIRTYGTGKLSDLRLAELVKRCFDLRPAAIIRDLGLKRPIYRQVAAYGHFGRTDIDLPWERLDKIAELKQELYK